MRILIVEDEARLAQALGQILQEAHYSTDIVCDGEDGLAYAVDGQYDIILLDVMLPRLSGLEVARRFRAAGGRTPILMLTARDEISDKVAGLDCGADDYMTKPFAPEELLARIRALLRRQGELVMETLSFGDLTLNLTACDLTCGARSVRLGHKEFEVLRLLMLHPRAILSKEELIVKVWGADSDVQDNNVEAYISFLRKKFFYLGSRVNIASLRRMGYRLEEKNA
ncbi:MAG TPA: response regulator transcription factor [Candidatus Avichristensenella intestinipullorum]|uniref:Stage 0 sporulation protein A homolog n=1 Tax=Candidatus Avichristensenella intestinipullorum TaxID=2840693 RepID=A0A9D0YXF8_9FIRM|nr:response regulator transcription factor [Candidatus Avichristensenella intestinipullorum]